MPDARPQGGILRVALDVPVRRLFDYLTPPSGAPTIAPGARIKVPFGRRRLIGVVVETAKESTLNRERLKPALEVLDATPILDADALTLLRWAAEYYHHPLGEALASALPKALRLGAPAVRMEERWIATAAGLEAFRRGDPVRAPRQRRLLALIAEHQSASATALGADGPGWREAAHALAHRGWAECRMETAPPSARTGALYAATAATVAPAAMAALDETAAAAETAVAAAHLRATGPPLTPEQALAVESICGSLGHYATWVLHGITGSGKTEVYLRAIEEVLRRGQRALVLVPEIGLTPQLVGRFRDRFDAPLAVLHSALTDQERLASWREAFGGEARIVIGTRSAVFAPVPQLGLIVVDEEHDASFKQHEGGFHYSARDVAVMRAQRAGIPIVLGSATPALETLHNVDIHRYERLSLPSRAVQSQPPRVSLVDLRAHPVHSGLSTPALQAIERHLAEAGQVLVFLNRRGYAPTLLCTACGWIAPCKDCDARLTVHRAAQRLRCHHCGADAALPERCPQCGFLVKSVGQGTERIEEALAQLFGANVLTRLDRDVVRQRGDIESALARIASGAARILVGTQMVTKGHDFPNMTLVVVLNADQGLFSTDFRAPERLAQTIVQVAGRAGRGAKPGEVLIQTEFPDHPLLRNLLAEGYDGFARTALAERAQAAWPPFSRLAAMRDSAATPQAALAFLTDARRLAGNAGRDDGRASRDARSSGRDARSSDCDAGPTGRATGKPPRVKLLGPVPAAMAKRAGRYHAQLLIESADRGALHAFLDAWLPEVEQLPSARRVRWALDVDPIELF